MAKYLIVALILGIVLIGVSLGQKCIANFINLNEQSQNWLFNLLLNLGSGLITSVFLLWLYDENLRKQTLKENNRRTEIAMKALELPLIEHFSILIGLYRSTIPNPPSNGTIILEELFDEQFFNRIKQLNFDHYPYGELSGKNWINIITDKTIKLQNNLMDILVRHGEYLDGDITEEFENIIGSRFVLGISSFPDKVVLYRGLYGLDIVDISGKVVRILPNYLTEDELEYFIETLREHVTNFIVLVKTHNRIMPDRRILLWDFFTFSPLKFGSSIIPKS